MPPPYTEVTIAALPTIAVDAAADLLEVYDTSGALSGKATPNALVTASNAATVNAANVFTVGQVINGVTGVDIGLKVNMAAGNSGQALVVQVNSVNRALLTNRDNVNYFALSPYDNGAAEGSYLDVGNNNNASTNAAGFVKLRTKGGTIYSIWPDATGNLRIGTTVPISTQDTSGTVVGAQTSHESVKTVEGERLPVAELYAALAAVAPHVARFAYTIEREAYGEQAEIYEGIILKEDAPETHRYGTDKLQEGYRAGKSLNQITAIGDLVRVVVDLARRVYELENKAP